MKSVAILGATGHIGRSLAAEFATRSLASLTLYARDCERLAGPPGSPSSGARFKPELAELACFPLRPHDVIINAVGRGDPRDVRQAGAEIVTVDATWDDAAIAALSDNRECLYVAISSGSVFGARREVPVDEATTMMAVETARAQKDYYAEAKLTAEAKHGGLPGFNIVDLRLFGYISAFLDPRGGFFLSQVLAALDGDTVLQVHPSDMVRDYISAQDLADLIELSAAARPINRAFDAYSAEPVSKFDLLAALTETFGLEWRISSDQTLNAGAIEKSVYYSLNRQAAALGYAPQSTAMQNVLAAIGERQERRSGAKAAGHEG